MKCKCDRALCSGEYTTAAEWIRDHMTWSTLGTPRVPESLYDRADDELREEIDSLLVSGFCTPPMGDEAYAEVQESL